MYTCSSLQDYKENTALIFNQEGHATLTALFFTLTVEKFVGEFVYAEVRG